MKTIKSIFTIAILLTLITCGKTRPESKGISKVTVAFSGYGCESGCPFQVLSVDEKLNATYYGGPFAERNGYYKGIISQEIWDSIQIRFDKFIIKGNTARYKKNRSSRSRIHCS